MTSCCLNLHEFLVEVIFLFSRILLFWHISLFSGHKFAENKRRFTRKYSLILSMIIKRPDTGYSTFIYLVHFGWLIDWLIGWLVDRLIDWLSVGLIDWLIDWYQSFLLAFPTCFFYLCSGRTATLLQRIMERFKSDRSQSAEVRGRGRSQPNGYVPAGAKEAEKVFQQILPTVVSRKICQGKPGDACSK